MLDPKTTVLLLIDVQKLVLDEKRHPSRPEFYRRAHDTVLPNLASLLRDARQAGLEVIYTVMASLTQDGRERSLDYKLSGFDLPKLLPASEVYPAVAPEGDEIVLPKSSANLFNSTVFDYVLRNMGMKTIICTGFLTDQCVEQTLKAGAGRSYQMICVHDACAANTNTRHKRALERFSPYCKIHSSSEVSSRLRMSHTPN